jgi:hypothetical protein
LALAVRASMFGDLLTVDEHQHAALVDFNHGIAVRRTRRHRVAVGFHRHFSELVDPGVFAHARRRQRLRQRPERRHLPRKAFADRLAMRAVLTRG